MYLLAFMIGAAGGVLSGMLGIGGGIVLFPALLYLPPVFGFEPLDVREVTGLTMVQGFFASLTAFIFYRSRGFVRGPLVLWLGIPLSTMSLMGALYSGHTDRSVLLVVFGILAIIAAVMMFRPYDRHQDETEGESDLRINRALALTLGTFLGFFLGMVGQGGAFIVIPVMLVIFRAPFRVAAGSMLAISLMATTAGFAGKAGVGLVPLDLSAALLIGAVPMSWAGGMLSSRVRTLMLRRILALIILLSALRIGADIYTTILK
jgi:uncharacterized membrane protein YfcA